MDPWDRDLAIRTIIGEAAGEDPVGQQAVANVILNRLGTGRWGNRPRDVVLSPNQFEPWGKRRSELLAYSQESPEYAAAAAALDAAQGSDVTGGATHFFSPTAQSAAGRAPPAWAKEPVAEVGRHRFYAPEGVVQSAGSGIDWDAALAGGIPADSTAAPAPPGGRPAAAPTPTSSSGSGIDWEAMLQQQPAPAPAAPPQQPPPGPGVNVSIGRRLPEGEAAGSYPQNIGRQMMQGVTANFADELGASIGALRALLTDEEYGALYNKILERNRAQDEKFSNENPVAATAAQIAGGVAVAPFTPALRAAQGAGLAARAGAGMVTGAGYGALAGAGAGEGLEGKAEGGAFGLIAGGGLGAAAPMLGAAARGAYETVRAPFRGAVGVDSEAARRVGAAFERDQVDIPSAQRALGMAQQDGYPLIAADLGSRIDPRRGTIVPGTAVHGLMRSAANTSPEARAALEGATTGRFQSQGDRAHDAVQAITGARGDTAGTLENLARAATRANGPAYRQAYDAPAAQSLWTPELEQLTTSPTFQRAMRAAEGVGRDDAALSGFPPIVQPFEFTGGRAMLRGNATPNLQFWDYVHRALRRAEGVAIRGGDAGRARDLGRLDAALTDHLDAIVPEFGQARAGAAAFFGARDAGEAGTAAVTSKMQRAEFNRAFGAMSAPEQAYFRETFANELLRQIRAKADRSNVTQQIFGSPQARDRVETVLGAAGARRIEALVRVENIMNMTKTALGNSTTARQLIEAGAAGGLAGYWQGNGDPTSITAGAMLGTLLRGGKNRIDGRVARRVGEMLASDDPQTLQRAADMVARNRSLMAAVQNVELWISSRLGVSSAPGEALASGIRGAAAEGDEPSAARP